MMITIKCKSCGEHIHIGSNFGNLCIFCGSPNEVPTSTDSQETHIERLSTQGENYLQNKKFLEATILYDNAIELYPNVSKFYWGRLLSQNSCCNDIELLKKGVNVANEPDYSVAFHFGSETEQRCYQKVKDVRELISGDMVSLMSSLELKEKFDTDIVNKQRNSENAMAELREQLKEQIARLDDIERKIIDFAIDSNAMLESEKKHIDYFVAQIEAVKSEVQPKSEVTSEGYDSYMATLKKYKNLCNAEWSIIQSKANIRASAEMKTKQTEQSKIEQEIDHTIQQINQVCASLQNINISVSQIHNKYKLARTDMDKGSFSRAVSLISDGAFTALMQKYIRLAR